MSFKPYLWVLPNLLKIVVLLLFTACFLGIFIILCPFVCFKTIRVILDFLAHIVEEIVGLH